MSIALGIKRALETSRLGTRLTRKACVDRAAQLGGGVGRMRITAQLIDARDGYHRWSGSYDRELGDVLEIQTEIATKIATALRVRLSSEEHNRLSIRYTGNLAAYQAYLLGRQRLSKRMTTTTEEAIGCFQKSIALDPKLSLAYVGLAEGYLEQFQNSDRPPGKMLARAQAAADKAMELDEGLAEAHAALAQVMWWRNDFDDAEAAFQRALVLNPNSVAARQAYGFLLGDDLARYQEALALHKTAVELDPLSIEAIAGLGENLDWLGQFDESLVWYERAREIDAHHATGYTLMGRHHRSVTGRLDDAVAWWAKGLALDPRSPWALSHLGWLFLDLGDLHQAEYWVSRALELGPESFYPNAAKQALASHLGDEAAALDHGRRAFAIWPLVDDVLGFLRDLEIRAGRCGEARALYETLFPELLHKRAPKVDLRNYRAAIDLALILLRTGEPEQGNLILDRSLQQVQTRPRLGVRGYGLADVQIYAAQGRKQKAVTSLRDAIDQGWRAGWWWWLRKPDLDPLQGDRKFQEMVEEIRTDMATQLAHVREMERSGELVFPAEPATPGPIASGSPPPAPR